jgi:hypothetical protein
VIGRRELNTGERMRKKQKNEMLIQAFLLADVLCSFQVND